MPHFLPRFQAVAVVAVLAMSAVAGQAWAQDREMPEMRLIAPQGARGDGGRSSLSEAIRRVQRSTGGQILGAERVPFDGRDINRIKYMDDRGRVRYMDDPVPERAPPRAPRSSGPGASDLSDGRMPPRGDNR